MNKTFFIGVLTLLILALAPAFQARAQYVPDTIEQKKGKLLDDHGDVMPDFMVQRLVGDEIYNQTYLGACKQYKTGKVLITAGLITAGSGLAVSGVSLGVFFADYFKMFGDTSNVWDSFMGAKDSVSWFYRGFSIAGLGAAAFGMGLIFKTIGWKRLEWVASNYNQGNRPATLRLGQGQYGTGLVLNF
mgnify:CR=1 FL=1